MSVDVRVAIRAHLDQVQPTFETAGHRTPEVRELGGPVELRTRQRGHVREVDAVRRAEEFFEVRRPVGDREEVEDASAVVVHHHHRE